jgi:hypothetical protein
MTSGAVSTLAGQRGVSAPFSDGVGTAATFNSPVGVARVGGAILLVVRVMSPECTLVLIVRAHSISPTPSYPVYALDAQADHYNHVIRRVNLTSGQVTTFVGRQGAATPYSDGLGSAATFFHLYFSGFLRQCHCRSGTV